MKFFPLFYFVLLAHAAIAQSPKIDELKIYKTPSPFLKDTLIKNLDLAFNVPGAKLLFENNLGKVYQLPLDNMKCLSPAFHSNMPVYQGNTMPFKLIDPPVRPVPIPNPFSKNPPVIITKPY